MSTVANKHFFLYSVLYFFSYSAVITLPSDKSTKNQREALYQTNEE